MKSTNPFLNDTTWYNTYLILCEIDSESKNEEYYPSERNENLFVKAVRMKNDSDLHSIIGKFYNEHKRVPVVDLKNRYISHRINKLIDVWRPDYQPPPDFEGQGNLF